MTESKKPGLFVGIPKITESISKGCAERVRDRQRAEFGDTEVDLQLSTERQALEETAFQLINSGTENC